MPPPDWQLRISDILTAIAKIQRYTQGFDLAGFSADEMAVDAVLRNFAVIGEAASRIPAEVCERYPNVPWARLRAIRSIAVHEYLGVDLRIVWDTIQADLPRLANQLERVREAD